MESLTELAGHQLNSYLSTKEVMVKHVVMTELILTVELSIPETERFCLAFYYATDCSVLPDAG